MKDRLAFLSSPTPIVSKNSSAFHGIHSRVSPFLSKCRVQKTSRLSTKKIFVSMAVSGDPVETRLREELAADGVNFDDLLNAGKAVKLTREIEELTSKCNQLAAGSEQYIETRTRISKLEKDLIREKRQVMQQWLKRLFVIQAFLFIGIGGLLSNDLVPGYTVPLVGQALGFWSVWLFVVPALRARKGTSKPEKSALNISFLLIPLVNVALPAFTKNCGIIWATDVALLASCYGYYALSSKSNFGDIREKTQDSEQGRIEGLLKFLDWGSWR